MTAALTPVLALAYLNELSADVRAAIVLDARGDVLASTRAGAARMGDGGDPRMGGGDARMGGGDAPQAGADAPPALAAAARDLLAEAPVVRALTDRGGAFGARDALHGIVVATGPLALPGLAIHDLFGVLVALGGTGPHALVSDASPVAAQALLDAL
jgi:hypothetical protein